MGVDNNFDAIIEELKRIHGLFPDLRFGEVLQSALDLGKGKSNVNFFDVPSKVILKALEEFSVLTKNRRRKKKFKND